MRRLLWLAAFAFGLGVALPSFAQSPGNFSTLSTTGTATLGGDVLMCSGRPWIDVRCNGAVGDDSHDDTTAINTTVAAAITNNWPVHFPAGTYKVTSPISIDYAGQASQGLSADLGGGNDRWARNRRRDRYCRSNAAAGRPPARPAASTSRKREPCSSTPSTPAYAVVFGKHRFFRRAQLRKDRSPDRQQCQHRAGRRRVPVQLRSRQRHLRCLRLGRRCGRAGIRADPVLADFGRRHRGRAPAAAAWCSKTATISAIPSSPSISKCRRPACRSPSITMAEYLRLALFQLRRPRSMRRRAIGNVLINPNYGGATVNFGPSSTGIAVIGSGSRSRWYFPSAASYTAAAIDDGINISSYNAPGASMTVTLPADCQPQPRLVDGLCDRQRQGHDRRRAIRRDPGGRQEPCLGNPRRGQLRVSAAAIRRQQFQGRLGDAQHASHQRVRPAAVAQQLALSVDLRAMPRRSGTMATSCRASIRPRD